MSGVAFVAVSECEHEDSGIGTCDAWERGDDFDGGSDGVKECGTAGGLIGFGGDGLSILDGNSFLEEGDCVGELEEGVGGDASVFSPFLHGLNLLLEAFDGGDADTGHGARVIQEDDVVSMAGNRRVCVEEC